MLHALDISILSWHDPAKRFSDAIVTDAVGKYFGLVIAYVIPGFIALWGMRPYVPTLDAWLTPSESLPAGIESVVFVTLLAIGAGMTASAARWLFIDSIHHAMGLRRPQWNDSALAANLAAFESLVDAHYRFYQFHANAIIAIVIWYVLTLVSGGFAHGTSVTWTLVAASTIAMFFATSRNNLSQYYRRASRLLGEPTGKEVRHVERPR